MGIWLDLRVAEDHRVSSCDPFYFLHDVKRVKNLEIGKVFSPCLSGSLYQNLTKTPSLLLAINGEIENLIELSSKLNLIAEDAAEVIFALYRQEGAEGIYRIKGSITLILHDLKHTKTILYRSFLNGFPLYFTNKNDRLTVCTNPAYILHRDDLSDRVDEKRIATLFTIEPLKWKDTVLSEIDEVAQGELIVISPEGIERKKQLLHDIFQKNDLYQDEKAAIVKYRTLLGKAVNTRIKPDKKYGIMLSSGMDSASIAYFAAQRLHEEGRELTAYSWTLPGDSADESEKIISLCKNLNIPLKMFNGEMFGPFDKLDDPFLLPSTPFINSFWPINQECYRRASEDGIDILFNGGYGDLLFRAKSSHVKNSWKEKIKQKGLRGIVRSLAFRIGWIEKQDKQSQMPWLTQEAKALAVQESTFLPESGFEHFKFALSPYYTRYLGNERYITEAYEIERIEPHKDTELLGFSLNFPSCMINRNGQTKYFAREAMRGLLPDEILKQSRVGNLSSFSKKSFIRNRKKVYKKVMHDPSFWNFYVREEWMKEKFSEGAEVDHKDLFVIRRCIDFSTWQKAIKPGGSLYEGKTQHR